MSNKRKTHNHKRPATSASSAQLAEASGLHLEATDTELRAELPDGKTITLSLILDLDDLFGLLEGIRQIDDDGDVMATLAAIRTIMPAAFRDQAKGVDAPIALRVFMAWVTILGERMGKALT